MFDPRPATYIGRRSRTWLAILMVGWLPALTGALARAAESGSTSPLRIAAAADLEPLLPSLLRSFERQTGIKTEVSFASSATLATQIENGAPFDVFLSADMTLPQRIERDGFAAIGSTASPYARGTLVLWARNTNASQGALTFQQLASPQIRSVALANPEHAPYGRAAIQALTSAGLLAAVQPKFRTAENIAQAAQFVSTGNADVGLISLTSAMTLTAVGHYVLVPQNAYAPILQGGVALRHGANAGGATAILRFLHSSAAQQAMRSGGLEPAS